MGKFNKDAAGEMAGRIVLLVLAVSIIILLL